MPVDRFYSIDQHSAYLVWRISEPIECLLQSLVLSSAEQAAYGAITHPKRQKAWLAARLALKTLLNELGVAYATLYKDPWGKPHLVGSALQISLAHGGHFAGAVVSRQGPVGIDLQQPLQQLQRVQAKFLTPTEVRAAGNDLGMLCIYWCAKEAIYKALGGQGLSLREDIYIQPFALRKKGVLQGIVQDKGWVVHYSVEEAYVLAWCREGAIMKTP